MTVFGKILEDLITLVGIRDWVSFMVAQFTMKYRNPQCVCVIASLHEFLFFIQKFLETRTN